MNRQATNSSEYIEVLSALSDPTRQRILELLSNGGPMHAAQLAAALPISRQAVVKHLRILERGGLVEARSQGRSIEFSVRPERTTQTAEWLARTAADWEQRLDRLRTMAGRPLTE